jgi:hypothetical protein
MILEHFKMPGPTLKINPRKTAPNPMEIPVLELQLVLIAVNYKICKQYRGFLQ